MSDDDRANRELAAVLESDLRVSGARTPAEMRTAAYDSLRSLTGADVNDGALPMIVVTNRGDGFKVKLVWPSKRG